MQSTAVNLEFKLKVIFKLLSCNRPLIITEEDNIFCNSFHHLDHNEKYQEELKRFEKKKQFYLIFATLQFAFT